MRPPYQDTIVIKLTNRTVNVKSILFLPVLFISTVTFINSLHTSEDAAKLQIACKLREVLDGTDGETLDDRKENV